MIMIYLLFVMLIENVPSKSWALFGNFQKIRGRALLQDLVGILPKPLFARKLLIDWLGIYAGLTHWQIGSQIC